LLKLEVEVIAKGSAAAASFKYTIAARKTAGGIDASAVELAKDILGTTATGALFDVEVTEDGSKVVLEVNSTGVTGNVYWNIQVVKMMKMAANGSVAY